MLLGTSDASLLENVLEEKISWGRNNQIRSGVNFEIQKCYENELKFSSVYSKNDYLRKDGIYVMNFDRYKLIGTFSIALYANGIN